MTVTSISLRERAELAYNQEQARIVGKARDQRTTQLERQRVILEDELRSRLGITITDPSRELHCISDGGIPVPAYKAPDTGDLFSIRKPSWDDEYILHWVQFHAKCGGLNWHRVRSLADFFELLKDEPECRCAFASWRRSA